jgi:subtilisin family serine protease
VGPTRPAADLRQRQQQPHSRAVRRAVGPTESVAYGGLFPNYSTNIGDPYGHGTHVASIIGSAGVATTGNFQGVAPGVNLVSVRVLDGTGEGTYFNVIRGIQWVMNNRLAYNIRVINLSLGATPSRRTGMTRSTRP